MRNKKILPLFSIIFLLFLFGSMNVWAGSDENGNAGQDGDYSITQYKKHLWGDAYVVDDWNNQDRLCSSGISSNTVTSEAKDVGDLCNIKKDPTIHSTGRPC